MKSKKDTPEIKALKGLFEAFDSVLQAMKLQAEMTKLVIEHLKKQDELLDDIYSYIDDVKKTTERLESKP